MADRPCETTSNNRGGPRYLIALSVVTLATLLFGHGGALAATARPAKPTFASATAARTGARSDAVAITGHHFAHVLSVRLSAPGVGTVNLDFTVVSPNEITAVVPIRVENKVKKKSTETIRVKYIYRSIDYTWVSAGIADTDNWSATT